MNLTTSRTRLQKKYLIYNTQPVALLSYFRVLFI